MTQEIMTTRQQHKDNLMHIKKQLNILTSLNKKKHIYLHEISKKQSDIYIIVSKHTYINNK